MFEHYTYAHRREVLKKSMNSGIGLFLGNEEVGMNYRDNPYPFFRQDSNFLYYFGLKRPNLIGWIDFDTGDEIIFGDDYTLDDFVWIGPHESLSDLAEKAGMHQIEPLARIATYAQEARSTGRIFHFLPSYRGTQDIKLSSITGLDVRDVGNGVSEKLIKSVVEMRAIKSSEEIEEIETALSITADLHLTAMKVAKPGMTEAEVLSKIYEVALASEVQMAYPIILTINGHVLHNHHHHNILKEGKLLLGDFGCESRLHYASDITRTFPVSKNFTGVQKAIYEIVLDALEKSVLALKPGITYREVHLMAAHVIALGLKEMGVMKGDPADAVDSGAHALFFPHGLGHMMGLDVHDMEGLGEDYVGYNEDISRSDQFGLAHLRMAKTLRPGFVLTVEPGIYFIPDLIYKWKKEGLHTDFIDYDKVNDFLEFSGIRIEDNVLIGKDGHKVLGPPIPKSVSAIEELRNQALS